MAHLKFIIRKNKSSLNSDGTALILLRYIHRSKVTHFTTGRAIKPEFWDFKNGQVKQAYKGFNQFNVYLNTCRQKVEDKLHRALSNEIEPTTEYIKESVNNEKTKKAEQVPFLSFYNFVEQFIDGSHVNKKESTIQGYHNTVRHLRNYEKYTGQSLTFDSFNIDFYNKFQQYIIEVVGCGNNAFGKQIRTLKTFLNAAIERGYKVNPAFKSANFKTISEDAENIYLNELELKMLLDLDLSGNQRLTQVMELFIVGSYTGMRFSDFSRIMPENVKNGLLYITTIKTNQKVVIPFHPYVCEIMKKYEGKYPNSLPPSISNQKMNEYLKELGKKAGLNEKIIICRTKGSKRIETSYFKYELITTHTARRSFATNLFKQGFPSLNIMKITGHTTEKSFMKYIKVKEEEAALMLKRHWEVYYSSKTSPLHKIA